MTTKNRARLVNTARGEHLYYMCPGCKCEHSVPPDRWHWNQSLVKPTLRPSVLHFIEYFNGTRHTICHYFIVDGKIAYCSDCPHELAGKTVDLPEIEDAT